jgi:hypothetical protein
MRNKKLKLILFFGLLSLMLTYIGWVFYLSEPTYIDNCYKNVEKFDYVSIPQYSYGSVNNEVENGIVLQVDSSKAIVKVESWRSDYTEIDLKQHNYRIIGKGTLYHKVNNYVGMNIMMITQIFIGILSAILIFTLTSILKEMLY